MADSGTVMLRFILCLTLAAGALSAQTGPIPAPPPGASSHLANILQLTQGGQNAESYWSPDGRRLIFQSTREPYQCDQIFTMNADGSDVRLVSTGKGRTTCGYFLKNGKQIVYASTHLAGDACPPAADRSKGYVWSVYPSYDIFLADLNGKVLKQLTTAKGYEAEATVNPRNGRILYTSQAGGDLDVWSMDPDGFNKRQITRAIGYDGGGVYSRDGKRIVWRARHPQGPDLATYKKLLGEGLVSPMEIEIWTAPDSGENARQLTFFRCASFAPTFTPDGDRIVFSSNRHACGSRNFELYMINVDGTGLKQITNFGGFTSFPEFSPDGKRLAFTSSLKAAGQYEFNIFVADWVEPK